MTAADAFATDLEPCYPDALRYCRALCADWSPSEAEDVLHDALVKALRGYGGLQDRTRFRPWLFQIITRTFHSAARRAYWKRFVTMEFPAAEGGGDRFPNVFARPEWLDERLSILGALAALNPKERAAVLLFELGGFSLQEIVEIQRERSLSAVKSRLSRARAKLKESLGKAVPSSRRASSEAGTDLDRETLQVIRAATA